MHPCRAALPFALSLVLSASACDNPRHNPLIEVARGAVTFMMGSATGDPSEGPVHPVTVPGYALERFEVTVAMYQACVDQGACSPPRPETVIAQGLSPQACNFGRPGREAHPVNCVTQQQAQDFCRWEDRRLPTEPEWELSARGTLGSVFPWGQDAPAAQACWARSVEEGTCAVGAFPRTLLGLLNSNGVADLGGNVWEWTSTGYCAYGGACDTTVAIRGGSWDYGDQASLRATRRLAVPGEFASSSVGLRCARSP